jgi:chromosome segregation and condensation protein ScpB
VRRGLLELVHEERPEGASATAAAEPFYRTSRKFLEVFRLTSLADLPEPLAPPK